MSSTSATRARKQRRTPHHRLTEIRVNKGLSPNDLAYRAGVSGKTIRMLEAGFIPGPRVQFQVAQALDLTPVDLWPFERGKQKLAA